MALDLEKLKQPDEKLYAINKVVSGQAAEAEFHLQFFFKTSAFENQSLKDEIVVLAEECINAIETVHGINTNPMAIATISAIMSQLVDIEAIQDKFEASNPNGFMGAKPGAVWFTACLRLSDQLRSMKVFEFSIRFDLGYYNEQGALTATTALGMTVVPLTEITVQAGSN